MIVIKLMGGLGNQMFQYAAGKALAEHLHVPLYLDRTFLDKKRDHRAFTIRHYELDVFRIEAEIADKAFVTNVKGFPGALFRETEKTYQKAFEHLKDPTYLNGHWQTEKYFHSIAERLRKRDLIPVDAISGLNADLMEQITHSNSASIHIRRGDYISDASAHRIHGVCSIGYYQQSAQLLVKRTGVEQFFVFSDDPDWVKANIRLPYPTVYISHNRERESYWDIHLMRHCRHHIIANSSFSWWGAWLNDSPDKIVIAPQNWYDDPSSLVNDVIPAGWLRVPRD